MAFTYITVTNLDQLIKAEILDGTVYNKFLDRMEGIDSIFQKAYPNEVIEYDYTLAIGEIKQAGGRIVMAYRLVFKLPDDREIGWFLLLNENSKIKDVVLCDPDLMYVDKIQ